MRYIVGFTDDNRGWDAIALASALARTQSARLELVHVVDSPSPGHVRALEPHFQAGLDQIVAAHPSVGEWRGTGFFYALELMGDRRTGRELTPDQSKELLTSVMPKAMRDVNLITRPDNRGATMLMLSPPLVADQSVLNELLNSVDSVMGAGDAHLRHGLVGASSGAGSDMGRAE